MDHARSLLVTKPTTQFSFYTYNPCESRIIPLTCALDMENETAGIGEGLEAIGHEHVA